MSGQIHAPTTLPHREQTLGIHWISGLRAGLRILEKKKISCSWRDSKHNSFVVQPVV